MLWAQSTLSGKIVDQTSGQVLIGASLNLSNIGFSQTDIKGNYSFRNLKNGTYKLSISYISYQTKEIEFSISSDQILNISLSKTNLLSDEVVVQATRASENSATTFKNLSKEELAKNNFGQDLPYLLDQTPGVVTYSDAGAGVGYTGIRIRGSDPTRVNVTINGIPYNDTESQGTYWVDLPDFVSSVDNIQIQRGVGTSTNGAGAFGGSLNIQTTTLTDSAYGELNNSVGSYGTLKNTLKLGTGLINGKWSFDGRLSRIVSDGYIDRASSKLKSYFLSGAYYGKTSLVRLNVFSGNEKTYQAWNGVPEDKLITDRRYNQFTYSDQTDNYQQDHYQLLYSKSFSPKFSFNGALHYTKGKGYYEEFKEDQSFSKYGLNNVTIGNQIIKKTNLIRRRWLDNDFYGLTYALNYKPSSILDFILGGAYNEYNGDHYGQVIWAQYASNSKIDGNYYLDNGFKTDFNIFGKVNIQLDKLLISGDLQFRKINYNFLGFDNKLNNVEQSTSLNFFNPKFGLTYQINPTSNIYGSLAVANKEPNRDDYTQSTPTSRPKSENLKDIEIGYRFKGGRISGGANLYAMIYKDQLVLTGQINDVGAYIRSNVADSYRNGLELDASAKICSKLSWGITAALSQNKVKNFTEYIDDYDNGGQVVNNYSKTDLAFSPSFVGGSTIAFKPFQKAEIAFISKYVSQQYLDNTSNEARKLKAFFVNSIRLSYNLKVKGIKNIGFGLLMNNIFNELYASNGYTFSYISGGPVTENYYYPQAETNFLASVNFKF
ncbi:MAG: TonB-dependent receptor [Bacteroidetes bacterium]|nr:TonB-dependent receptor [Bacteroidota bacterium]MBU1373748.1 TonB-dependent receptor [Bacteroidota bacterium]MBU1486142.1 TonB-dependent receptor [Bacteroidota bacterium]MBU1761209.1 TonB-dependent receptor [Bacteroidota bacterium]MBU2045327.1 TonB-dependent receptor [Bacteroidota bacterium]